MDKQQSLEKPVARMIDRLEERYGNAIHDINLLDQSDHVNGIDAVMIDCIGNVHKLQLTSQQTSIRIKLVPCQNQTAISFAYDDKHLMIDTKAADIFVQELSNGSTFIYTALQLHVMAQYDEFYMCFIHQDQEGQYLLSVPQDVFSRLLIETCNSIAID